MSIALGPAPHLAHHLVDLKNRRRDSVLAELARHAARCGDACEPELLTATLLQRERLVSTATGHGFAVPNARSLLVTRPITILGRSRHGVEWASADEAEVHSFILVLSPGSTRATDHVAAVSRVLAALRLARGRQKLAGCADATELAALLAGAAS
jgi:mannitol/fructose-specific phosphotransferase system IIA component (Ntr-type)